MISIECEHEGCDFNFGGTCTMSEVPNLSGGPTDRECLDRTDEDEGEN